MGNWQSVFWPRLLGYLVSAGVILLEAGTGRWQVWLLLGWLLSLPPSYLWLQRSPLRHGLNAAENLLVPLAALALGLPALLICALAFSLLLAQLSMGGLRRALTALGLMCTGLVPALALTGWPGWTGSPVAAIAAALSVALYALCLAALTHWQHRRLQRARQQLAGQARQHAELAERLARYLPPAVHRASFDAPDGTLQRSRRRWLTVCFMDLAGFTARTEHLDSEDVVSFLNELYALIAEAALKTGGTLDKFIGDAAMVFYGEPTSAGRSADAAACLQMAVEVRQRLAALQRNDDEHGRIAASLALRVGIHSGWCTVGTLGKRARLDYTVIGTTVNLASRLEALAAPDEILLSADTAALLTDQRHCLESLGETAVKGLSRPVETFRYRPELPRPLRWQRPGLQLELDPTRADLAELERLLEEVRGRCRQGLVPCHKARVDPVRGPGYGARRLRENATADG